MSGPILLGGGPRPPLADVPWSYRDAFFELVPPPGRATLEIGCGDGVVCRDLAARGHAVCGIDTSLAALRTAARAHPEGTYAVADAAALPFADGAFDLVVAYNALTDIDDMPGAVREAERVLAPGGAFCITLTNPPAGPARSGRSLFARPLSAYSRALASVGLRIEARREPRPPHDPGAALPAFVMWRAAR